MNLIFLRHGESEWNRDNSLRTLVKYLDDIPDDAISGLNIPAGLPLVYEPDGDPKPQRNYYLE